MLNNWENQTLDYDHSRYPWARWVLEVIQEVQPSVQDLEDFHKTVDPTQIFSTTLHVQKAFGRREFMQRFDAFAEEYGQPLIDHQPYMLKRQATLNLVVPNQKSLGRLLPFHQGVWYANGRGQRTIWLALTRCFGSNSMWVLDTETSRNISRDMIQNQWDQQRFENECMRHAWPVEIGPGQCHLFHQEIMHGNVNNQTDITRMSIDWHLLVKGGEYGKRLPGGFFRFPGDHGQSDTRELVNKVDFVEYLGNNTEYDKGIPPHLQRMVMDEYCRLRQITINYAQSENEYLSWMPVLEHTIKSKVPGIVMNSIYSLPDHIPTRQRLMKLALDLGVEMHFANEYLVLRSPKEFDLIERYRQFAVAHSGPHSWEISVRP